MENYLLCEDDGLLVRSSGSWAQDKLFYVKSYIDAFETSMRDRPWRNRIYIDLFAGPGKCKIESTQEYFLGSPLLALTTEYPFTDYFFVDKENECLDSLEKRSQKSNVPQKNIRFLVGKANKKVFDITNEIKNIDDRFINGMWPSLNLAFLDPTNLELEWSIVEELAKMKRMDFIIHYSQMGVERNIEKWSMSEKETNLDRFFGGIEWKDIYNKNKNSAGGFHRPLLNHYKSNLKKLGYAEIKDDEEIWTEPLMCNKNNAPLYRLIFASKNELGLKFWKNITSKKRTGQIQLL